MSDTTSETATTPEPAGGTPAAKAAGGDPASPPRCYAWQDPTTAPPSLPSWQVPANPAAYGFPAGITTVDIMEEVTQSGVYFVYLYCTVSNSDPDNEINIDLLIGLSKDASYDGEVPEPGTILGYIAVGTATVPPGEKSTVAILTTYPVTTTPVYLVVQYWADGDTGGYNGTGESTNYPAAVWGWVRISS